MKTIAYLFDSGSRYPQMIAQGLLAQQGVSVVLNKDVVSYGTVIATAEPALLDGLKEADLIFRTNDLHFNNPSLDTFLDKENLWERVVYVDFKDSPQVDSHRLTRCCAYVKRSWSVGIERTPLPPQPRRILPLDYCVLDEYLVDTAVSVPRYDIVYPVRPDASGAVRRYSVYRMLQAARFPLMGGGEEKRYSMRSRGISIWPISIHFDRQRLYSVPFPIVVMVIPVSGRPLPREPSW